MHDLESQAETSSTEVEKLAEPSDLPSSKEQTIEETPRDNDSDNDNENTHESSASPGSTPLYPETDLSNGIVGWDGQDDPANPQNFPAARKWGLLAVLSSMTFISPLASSMFSPAVEFMALDFGVTNETLLSFSVTIYLLGYTVGPLIFAPLSEIYGRRVILSCANWFFVVWQIGCALAPNLPSFIVFRLLAGMGGVGCITIGAGVIADLFPVEKRAMASAIWSMGPLMGPVVGPVAGGFIGETIGWRWVFWILLIVGGALAFSTEILNRETYARVLIRWKTERLAKELGRNDLRSGYAQDNKTMSTCQALAQGFKRPVILFFKSPIVALIALYMAAVYGMLYLFFTTMTTVFVDQYGFSTGLAGLAYLGIGFGFLFGLAIVAKSNDRTVMKLTARNGGVFEPEMRLVMMIIFSCITPISFFWYGWTADKHVQWMAPIIGTFPFGVGMMGLFLPSQTYIIDCYPTYAASAVATLTTTRSLVGALLPLAGPKMFDALGLGWGNSVLGFIALAFVPVPILFNRYGKTIRTKYVVDLH